MSVHTSSFIICTYIKLLAKGIPQLTAKSDCLCPGQQALFECTIFGQGTTVWQGSGFHCNSDEIQLLHITNQFEGVTNICNDGAIVARGVSAIGSCYTSQLNVTLDQGSNGTTIRCSYDDGSGTIDIGDVSVIIVSGKD